jgi:hypothetical protein
VGPRQPDAGGDAVIVSAWSILAFPSVTTVALLLLWWHRPRHHELLFPVIAVAGIALYATTIGTPAFNMYRLGFSPYAPLVLAIVAALGAARAPKIALIVLAVIVAYDLHLYRSRNLFDYAIDPILVLVATVWCVRRLRHSSLVTRYSGNRGAGVTHDA